MMPTTRSILREFTLTRFYIMLGITLTYFLIQLITAHLTHSLILQIDAYHMLYNILSLVTCIVTVKMSMSSKGFSVKNTFGWTRIHVCGVVANICFLAALGFSVTVESIQTIIHQEHHDTMHHSAYVAIVGFCGLVVNALAYCLIGGYTFHQTSFLEHSTKVDDFTITENSVRQHVQEDLKSGRRQDCLSTFRDVFGNCLVIFCSALILLFETKGVTDYIDPVLTILTVILLAITSVGIAKESGRVLLLTIPDHINVRDLVKELKETVPELYDIHDIHVWQLTPARIIVTAHIVLHHTIGYIAIQNSVVDYLHSKGISHITLQPEFLQITPDDGSPLNIRKRKCFIPCGKSDCYEKQCCTAGTLTPCSSSQIGSSVGQLGAVPLSSDTQGTSGWEAISTIPEGENLEENSDQSEEISDQTWIHHDEELDPDIIA